MQKRLNSKTIYYVLHLEQSLMKRFLDILKLFLGLPISILSLFFIGKIIFQNRNFSSIQFENINFYFLLLGILCFLIYFVIRAYLWQKILSYKGHEIPLKDTAFLWAFSELKRYVPGSIWGFLSRGLLFSKKNVDKKTTVLLFLAISFFLYKIKNNFFLKLENLVIKYRFELLLSFFILIYCTYFISASFLRYDNFFTGRFDLGNMDQTVWNTLHGRFFQFTNPNGTETISRLAYHADFILALFSPLYLIWSDPRVLLIIQTIVISLGSIFIFLLAKKILKNNLISLVLSASYLLNPALQHANLYDFHAVTLAATFLLGCFYFLYKQQYFYFLIFAILSGITKENIWIIIALFGLYIFFSNTKFKYNFFQIKNLSFSKQIFGLLIFIISSLIFYALIWITIPNARGGEHFALSYYSDFGDTPGTIVKNILLSPQKTILTIFQEDRLSYLNYIFMPFGYLPLFSPFALFFALPDFIIILLSKNIQFRQVYYHYSVTLIPFVFISTIFALKNIINRFSTIPVIFYCFFLIFTSLFSAYLHGPLPFAKNPNILMFTNNLVEKNAIYSFLKNVTEDKSVSATNNLGSHLARRKNLYTIPEGLYKADYVIFLLNDPFAQPSPAIQKNMVYDLKKDKRYNLIIENGDFFAFEKN